MFFVSGVSLHLSHYLLPSRHLRHEEHDQRVMFFMSGVSLHCSLHPILPRGEKCDHMVAFFTSGVFPQHSLDPLRYSGYKNMTHWVMFLLSIPFLLLYSMY